MKDKHLDIRIRQCLVLSEASSCPRRKFGAVLIDPQRNVVLADGYNGGPRGQPGDLCRGSWCERDGLTSDKLSVQVTPITHGVCDAQVLVEQDQVLWSGTGPHAAVDAAQERERLLESYPKIPSGTRMERGCHHAESNVIANAAANGVTTRGAWLIVTGEPCAMCARLIHHAGIEAVVVVDGGYAGGRDGIEYLTTNNVKVVFRDGPKDPRLAQP